MSLWGRITCPTLLMGAEESFLESAKTPGLEKHFPNARAETVMGAGHWLHHEKPDEVLASIRRFLGLPLGGPRSQPSQNPQALPAPCGGILATLNSQPWTFPAGLSAPARPAAPSRARSGVSPGRITQICEGELPSLELAERIARETAGAVTPNDFLGLVPSQQWINSLMSDTQARVTAAVEAFGRGEIVVVTDDDDRENEGDLVMAAVHATPEKMAFIIRNTCGIVCTPLPAATAHRLRLSSDGVGQRRHAQHRVHRRRSTTSTAPPPAFRPRTASRPCAALPTTTQARRTSCGRATSSR